jgi:hypothetical protein
MVWETPWAETTDATRASVASVKRMFARTSDTNFAKREERVRRLQLNSCVASVCIDGTTWMCWR